MEVINSKNQKSKLYIHTKAQLHIYDAGITSNISLGHTPAASIKYLEE